MNEQVRNILEQSTTKTSKIEQLLRLGLTRREIADLVTRGNYGFVYNVEKKMLEREGGVLLNRAATTLMDYTFTHKFGIEIEAYNCNMERLARELREAGIHVAVEGYNHTTRDHWKLVTDSSLQGNNTFELVINNDRYHKVNFEAYSRHRTVEFRQHSGTTNFTKMENWIRFLNGLITFAKRSSLPSRMTLEGLPFLDGKQKLFFKLRTKKLAV